MRYRMPVLAAGALATALAFGSYSTSSADPLPVLNEVFVLDSDPFMVTLVVDATPEAEGAEATIMFGGQPFDGFPVDHGPLLAGPNMRFVPNMGPGWYTAVGAFAPAVSNFDELPAEE